jgi:hypothetical protein
MRWRGLETLFQANRHFQMEPKTKEYAELDALEARFGRSRASSAASLDSEKRDTRIE